VQSFSTQLLEKSTNRWDREREEQPEEDIAGVAVGGLDGDNMRSIRNMCPG